MKNTMGTKGTLFLVPLLIVLAAVVLGVFSEALAQHGGREFRHREFVDSRYGHDRRYPMRGEHFEVLPRNHRVYVYHGERFFFAGGVWYRPFGPRFVVVAPPFGLVIPFLPPYYTTIWVGGVPYYYANDVYYTPAPGGYVVVAPPQGLVSQVPPPSVPYAAPSPPVSQPGGQLYIYPRKGQTEQQQAKDRYECHRWAVGQTGYDPTDPAAASMGDQKRADYNRAMGACLEGRGYTVK